MANKTTMAEVLQFETFDPTQLDISEIQEMTASIPADGNVDISIAENLATKFLRGADRCSEILSILTWWEAGREDRKRHVFSTKFFEAPAHGHKTAAAKKAWAEGSKEYLDACAEANKAKAMKQWIKNKHESLVSAHYLMKHIAKGGQPARAAAGSVRDGSWEPAGKANEPQWGEQDWK
jgi:hypothetical protein